jgi:hypothetical protein
MLVRMPRPDDVSGSVNKNHQNDDDDDRSPMTAALSTNNNNPNRRKNDRKMERSLQDSSSVCRSSQCLKTGMHIYRICMGVIDKHEIIFFI